ncbi:diacylglycerol/lipid kinase family protein [Magnetospirillum sulfuroxidans]|uniref:Diacylglycerol kinase family lipid kinase n=1 Tax=Magnetospirillum sulfuroxidans TaxID=611300 RepID=A0ABS5IHH8_9PROT|nr:diacylglycerol kinase family protein [Magnetospirillum sulfuroxidans]MBR9973158.1 diacylglycerol kinase family lipid kinase [Magnetospirillum sulfuroxidans]
MIQTDNHTLATAQARRCLVIHNPTAGRRRKKRLADVLERLQALGCLVTAVQTTQRGDAEAYARAASPADYDVIVAAGGDGTVNEVVNGMVDGPGGVALAVIPLGTANVLALEIGLDPKNSEQIAQTIADGPVHNVHLGVANGRHFVLMAGAGLDAHVVEGVNIALKRATGKLAYVVESVKQAFGYDFPEITVRANGEIYEGRMAVACKGRYYGGPFIAAPDARLESPKLEVCILPKSGVAGMMRYGLALPMNKLSDLPEVMVISAESMVIMGPRGAPLQGDGDIVARLPAEISIAPQTVQLIVPASPG